MGCDGNGRVYFLRLSTHMSFMADTVTMTGDSTTGQSRQQRERRGETHFGQVK
jgi:hypothetical protein